MGGSPRISGFSYIGRYAYFLTICTHDRIAWFSSEETGRSVVTQLLRTSVDYGFDVIAYCLMPDHLHSLVEGTRPESNLRKYVAMFKQRTSFEHTARYGRRLWQYGYFDRVLREDEPVEGVSAYIVSNPIRAGICDTLGEYPFLGSSRYSVEQLREAVQIWANRTRP